MSVDLSVQAEPTVSVITTVPVSANGGEMDALLLGRIGVSTNFFAFYSPLNFLLFFLVNIIYILYLFSF